MAFVARTRKETKVEVDYMGGTFIGSPLTNSDYTKLRKKYTKKKMTRQGEVEDFDSNGLLIEKFQRVVTGWDIIDEDGNRIDCNETTKAEFLDLNTTAAFDIITLIDEAQVAIEEAAAKN